MIIYVHSPFNIFGISWCLSFCYLLVMIGFCGFLICRLNSIFFLVCNEIILLGIVIAFIGLDTYFFAYEGQMFAIILLVISAIETALISTSFLVYFQQTSRWEFELLNSVY
jgi:NADH:ubiquinone oxidoreductase subunit K